MDCYYSPFMRLEHGKVRSKDMRDMKPENNEGVPVVPQVIVRDVKELDALTDVVRTLAMGVWTSTWGVRFLCRPTMEEGLACWRDQRR